MIGRVRETIERYAMLSPGDTVAVGLSGGADSVCLLSVLLELGYSVRAIHVNHGIRGESALADEQFCRTLCASLGVELDCVHADIPAEAARRGIGLEQCGRECRYEHFQAVCNRCGCRIATAHTLSDSAETVLFNLARGSGLAGVCGIPPVRGSVIRPLIDITREDVEQYCADRGLSYVTDESNADTVYRRNLIRHEVIPSLRAVNPSFHGAMDRFMQSVREDNSFLEQQAALALDTAADENGWDAAAVAALPSALFRRAVIAVCRTAGVTPEHTQVMLCCECVRRGSGAVVLGSGVRFVVSGGRITVDGNSSPAAEEQWSVPVTFPETLLPDGRKLSFVRIDLKGSDETQKNHKLLFKNSLSCDIIFGNTSISARNRRDGDRFAPVGRKVTKRLKKLLCEEGVALEARGRLAILEGSQGILWVEGFGASELGKPSPDDRYAYIPYISGKEN